MNGPSPHLSRRAKCHPDRPHKAHGLCKACYASSTRKAIASDPDRRAGLLARERAMKAAWVARNRSYVQKRRRATRYGLTVDQLNALLVAGCALCATTDNLTVDHDHKTGAVRGCLCQGCNNLVGYVDSHGDKLVAAAAYLEKAKNLDRRLA